MYILSENYRIGTNAIRIDNYGFYIFEKDLTDRETGWDVLEKWERTWKCPYCFKYWPIGKPCANPDCPSKYR